MAIEIVDSQQERQLRVVDQDGDRVHFTLFDDGLVINATSTWDDKVDVFLTAKEIEALRVLIGREEAR